MNMKSIRYIFIAAAALSVCGCGLFGKYTSDVKAPGDSFGPAEVTAGTSTSSTMASLSWREFFTDPYLQQLIDTALVRNVDVNSAKLLIAQAEANVKAAKLGYLPSFTLNPSFTIAPQMGYVASLSGEWGVQGFGSITNRLRETKAIAAQASDRSQSVKAQVIAAVAQGYSNLQWLDRQLEIVDTTVSVWKRMLQTQRALMENGKAYSTAVDHLEASLYGVYIRKEEIQQAIADTESSLCLLLGWTPRHIVRNSAGEFAIPDALAIGVPANMLENRADVKAAGRDVEIAYYLNKQALSAMLPSLSLSGLAGWTNGSAPVASPGGLIANALASLVQPVFAQGKLRANYKISKLQQQQSAERYVQTVLEAGNEVNSALRACQSAGRKSELYRAQVTTLERAYDSTVELMHNGKAMYLEVLNAQNTLLDARLGQAANSCTGACDIIDLYIALGGATRE